MKRIFLLLTLLSYIGMVSGQGLGLAGAPSVTGKITGTITDSLTRSPIDYATIALGRTGSAKSTNGSLTDAKGSFKIENIAAGTYRLTIAFLGYQTKIIDSVKTTPEKPDLNMGRILLTPNQKMLNEVVITGTTPIVENKIDKLVYNAEQDVAIAGGKCHGRAS